MLRKILSFLIPVSKRYNSEVSGRVEVTTMYGHKEVNTLNANYSYGSLQRILKKGLKQMDLRSVDRILILGIAGGSVIKTLRKDFGHSAHITGVEVDPLMLELAKAEFEIDNDGNTNLILMDAAKYVQLELAPFDLIIVDLFIDDRIPQQFTEQSFWSSLIRLSNGTTQILLNTIRETATGTEQITQLMEDNGWCTHKMALVDGTNDLFIFDRPK